VSICKVVLDKDSDKASYGLKATCTIQQGTFIKETSSSMSTDVFEGLGPSVIQPTPGQLGPQGPRMILGPFRLVNHDCKPNGQVSGTPAYLFSGMPISRHQCRYMPFPRQMHFAWSPLRTFRQEQKLQLRMTRRPTTIRARDASVRVVAWSAVRQVQGISLF
jgi:hypothetical protein